MSYPYPDEGTWWAQYSAEVAARYAVVGRVFPDDAGSFLWFSRCGWDIGAGMDPNAAAAKHLRELEQALGITGGEVEPPDPPIPPKPPSDRVVVPIQGHIRTEGDAWRDDSGSRSLRLCSWFPALRCYRDKRDDTLRELDTIAAHWHGVRIFWHLGVSWWAGYEVDPRWPDFDALFTSFLRECSARGLRVSLSTGDMQVLCPDGREDSWHAHIADLAASVDPFVVSHWGIWNEGWQNSARGEDPAYAAHLSGLVQARYPWNAHALTDTNEEPSNWAKWGRSPANTVMIHGERGWPNCMNRAFNTKYEGVPGTLLNFDEPTGLGPNVTTPLHNPQQLFGLYTVMLITGATLTYFGGHGLKSWRQAGDLAKDWGFVELPHLWQRMALPEDAAWWRAVPGHRGDAAVYPTSFADRGSGPHRCDGMINPDQNVAWYVVSAGVGAWDLRCRWNGAEVTVWRTSGPTSYGRLAAGQSIPNNGPSEQAIVVEVRR